MHKGARCLKPAGAFQKPKGETTTQPTTTHPPRRTRRQKEDPMKLADLTFEKIENYDPFNSRAMTNGMVTEWVARNEWGNAVAFGDTKAECTADARRYVAMENGR